jgi:hypothetical protein
MAAHKAELWTELARLPTRHPATDPEGPGLVGSGKHNPAPDGDGFATQRRVEQLLDRGIEGIEIRMKNGGCRCHPNCSSMKFEDTNRSEQNENMRGECQAGSATKEPRRATKVRACGCWVDDRDTILGLCGAVPERPLAAGEAEARMQAIVGYCARCAVSG